MGVSMVYMGCRVVLVVSRKILVRGRAGRLS